MPPQPLPQPMQSFLGPTPPPPPSLRRFRITFTPTTLLRCSPRSSGSSGKLSTGTPIPRSRLITFSPTWIQSSASLVSSMKPPRFSKTSSSMVTALLPSSLTGLMALKRMVLRWSPTSDLAWFESLPLILPSTPLRLLLLSPRRSFDQWCPWVKSSALWRSLRTTNTLLKSWARCPLLVRLSKVALK